MLLRREWIEKDSIELIRDMRTFVEKETGVCPGLEEIKNFCEHLRAMKRAERLAPILEMINDAELTAQERELVVQHLQRKQDVTPPDKAF